MPLVRAHADGPVAHAVRTTAPIDMDGVLGEPVWMTAPPLDEFYQLDPDMGAPPTERTEIRFLYDDEAIYVGAWNYESPSRIATRFLKRDTPQSDT